METYGRKAARRQAPILHVSRSRAASEPLFHFLAARYERGRLIITNLEFREWPQVFGYEKMTAAMVSSAAIISPISAS